MGSGYPSVKKCEKCGMQVPAGTYHFCSDKVVGTDKEGMTDG